MLTATPLLRVWRLTLAHRLTVTHRLMVTHRLTLPRARTQLHPAQHRNTGFEPSWLSERKYSSWLDKTDKGACVTKKKWPVSFPQEELKKRLTPIQYHVTQERGTERAFAGELTHNKDEGTYNCVVCGAPLFSSNTKFDSGSGWPSFFDIVKEESITQTDDFSYGMHRVETTCSQCGAHLGHLFDDGPRPTGKRYCINSASLSFQPSSSSSSSAAEGSSAASSSVSDKKTEF